MIVLVTGGAGFIGSHLCDALLARGDEVICIDSFNDYYDSKIKENNIKHNVNNKNFKLFKIDILDSAGMESVFESEKPDKVVHLAARAGVRPSLNNPLFYEKVNIRGTLNLLELAKEFNVKNFIFGSSSSVYGNRKASPFSEGDNVDFPVSPYAATKKAGELLCYTYHHLYGINVSCLRFFTVYGPRGRPDMAPLKFTKLIDSGEEVEIYGDGTSQRDYTYVGDIVEGILSALDANSGYEIFNLGSSDPVELNYFISLIEKALGKEARRKYVEKQQGDVGVTFADISKAKKLLSYDPKIGVEEGVRKLVEWYKQK